MHRIHDSSTNMYSTDFTGIRRNSYIIAEITTVQCRAQNNDPKSLWNKDRSAALAHIVVVLALVRFNVGRHD